MYDPEHSVPLSVIKNYFSRLAKCIKEGKCKIGEVSPDVTQSIDVAGRGELEVTKEMEETEPNTENSDDDAEE